MSRRYRHRGGSTLSALFKLAIGICLIYIWPVTLTFIVIKILISLFSSRSRPKRRYTSYNKKVQRQIYKKPHQEYTDYKFQSAPLPLDNPSIQRSPLPSADISYSSKESLMTDCEKEFFRVFRKVLPNEYILQPQINLASIINKESFSQYQNELFRNIDFGVFDQNYTLKLLIEINDATHTQPERIERDKKVAFICAQAGIPLITFWTKYGINEIYIKKRLYKYLQLPIITTDPTAETILSDEANDSKF